MVCLYCLEDLPENKRNIVTCKWCGARYTSKLLTEADPEFWEALAFNRSQTHKLWRFNTKPPSIMVTLNA